MSATDQQANVGRSPNRLEDLHDQEKQLVDLMRRHQFGKVENVRILEGLPRLGAEERLVRAIKFGVPCSAPPFNTPDSFALKAEVIELLEATRAMRTGVIRRLEFRHGLPAHLELEVAPDRSIQVDGV